MLTLKTPEGLDVTFNPACVVKVRPVLNETATQLTYTNGTFDVVDGHVADVATILAFANERRS